MSVFTNVSRWGGRALILRLIFSVSHLICCLGDSLIRHDLREASGRIYYFAARRQ